MARVLFGDRVHHLANGAALTIGRGDGAQIVVCSTEVSRYHANVTWTGHAFVARDLGSRNGTRVGDALLASAEERALRDGDRVQLGRSDGPMLGVRLRRDELTLVPIGPARAPVPPVMATPGDGITRGMALAEVHVFPEPGWKRASVTVRMPGRTPIVLGDAAHFWLLVVLVEARDDLAARESAPAAQPWMSAAALQHRLRLSRKGLNTRVFRVRAAFRATGIAGAGDILVRSPDGRGIRLGVYGVRVVTERDPEDRTR